MRNTHPYKTKALYNFVKCNTSSSQQVIAGQEEELSPSRNGFPQIETTTQDTYYVVLSHFIFISEAVIISTNSGLRLTQV